MEFPTGGVEQSPGSRRIVRGLTNRWIVGELPGQAIAVTRPMEFAAHVALDTFGVDTTHDGLAHRPFAHRPARDVEHHVVELIVVDEGAASGRDATRPGEHRATARKSADVEVIEFVRLPERECRVRIGHDA